MKEHLRLTITQAISALSINGNCGNKLLHPVVADALRAAGYEADKEDTKRLLGAGLPVWRSKDSGEVERTQGRRRVDIVVYKQGRLVALIEIESSLDDLCQLGVSRRNGHYDVSSIARCASAIFFNSYKSLERMAATAFYVSLQEQLDTEEAVARLSAIRSDLPTDHNPLGVHLLLVSGRCRKTDREILAARLKSLDAELMCVRQ